MTTDADSWPHHVLIAVGAAEFDARLRDVETWLAEWEIPHRIGSTMIGLTGSLRVCLAEAKFARAVQSKFGGVIVPSDGVARSLAADAADDDRYDALAREYDVDD